MTTIAYRSGVLAADTLIAYSSITNGQRNKISRCGNYTVALAGPAWLREPIETWCSQDCSASPPSALVENEGSFAALIIRNKTGQVFEYDSGYLLPVMADYTAIGSGALLALGAMAHGASAVEAVEAAALHDKNTGGPVTSLSFPLKA